MKTLPPIPKFVDMPAGRIVVLRETPSHDDTEVIGTYRWHERAIRIDPTCNNASAWHILEHELVHAIFLDAGVVVKKKKLLELICDTIASARVSEKLRQAAHRTAADAK